jgi:molecular chaperone GrpE
MPDHAPRAGPVVENVDLVDDADDDATGLSDRTAAERELEQQLRRALADLDNLRKRFEREVARERASERERVTRAWLAVLDDLERAIAHAGDEETPLVTGVRAARDNALAILAALGYQRTDDVGKLFDPARHEALGAVLHDEPPGTVVAVVRPGYGTETETLRPAAVIVARERD